MSDSFTICWQDALQAHSSFHDACFQLYESMPCARFYHHPDWLLAGAEHLLSNGLRLVLVSDHDNHPLMLLPLSSDTGAAHAHLLNHDHLSLNDALVHKRMAGDEILGALSAALAQANPKWASFNALDVPDSSQLAKAVGVDNKRWLVRTGRSSAFFDCSTTIPIPGKLRRNLTRLRKQLASTARIETRICTTADELPEAYDSFLALEKSSWKGRGVSTAIADNPSLTGFYQQMLTPRFPGLKPMVSLITADGKAIAAQYGVIENSTLSLLKVAYDETFAHYSPGSLLLHDVMAYATELDIDILSLVTAPAWATRWHPVTSSTLHLSHYNQNPAGIARSFKDNTRQSLKQRISAARLIK